MIINIINSDKFILLKNKKFIDNCISNVEPNYMDSKNSNNNSSSNQEESSSHIRRFADNNSKNTFNVNISNLNDRTYLEVSGNNSNNSVTVTSNRNNIGTVNIVGLDLNRPINFIVPNVDRKDNSLLPPYSNDNIQSDRNINHQINNVGSSSNTSNITHKDIYNFNNRYNNYGVDINAVHHLIEQFDDLFTRPNNLNNELENYEKDLDDNIIITVTNDDNINNINESFNSNIIDENLFNKDFNNESLLNIENINDFYNNEFSENDLLLNKDKSIKVKDSNVKSLGKLKNNILKRFRSEGNIGKLFIRNKSLTVKSFNYPFNNNNVFIIPNDLYESLLFSSNKLLSIINNNIININHINIKFYIK